MFAVISNKLIAKLIYRHLSSLTAGLGSNLTDFGNAIQALNTSLSAQIQAWTTQGMDTVTPRVLVNIKTFRTFSCSVEYLGYGPLRSYSLTRCAYRCYDLVPEFWKVAVCEIVAVTKCACQSVRPISISKSN